MEAKRKLRRRIVALAVAVITLAAPAAASAGTVSVEETEGTYLFEEVHFVDLRFAAVPGEDNGVVVDTASEQDEILQVTVVDNRAPLEAGAGCSGGGPPGTAATCTIHAPGGPKGVPGFGKGIVPIPGTRWIGSMTIDLGDGRNAFDGSSFTAELNRSFGMSVDAGGGEDQVLTGGGADTIDPGGGADSVHTGDGEDRVVATATPDGPDVYDLGTEYYNPSKFGADEVDYSRRSAPVEWDGFSGVVAGEGDRLNGVENIFGGSGDDVLRGNEFENFLVGGPGDDLLVGGFNWDILMGGEGADELRGGLHPDVLLGQEGDDAAFGGRGHDLIKCSDGWDRALRIDKDRMFRCEVQRLFGGGGLDALRPSA